MGDKMKNNRLAKFDQLFLCPALRYLSQEYSPIAYQGKILKKGGK